MENENINTDLIKQLTREQKALARKHAQLASDFSIHMNRDTERQKKILELEALGEANGKKIDRILLYLENDDTTGQKGLVYEVRENSAFRRSSLTQVKMISVLISAVIAFLVSMFKS